MLFTHPSSVGLLSPRATWATCAELWDTWDCPLHLKQGLWVGPAPPVGPVPAAPQCHCEVKALPRSPSWGETPGSCSGRDITALNRHRERDIPAPNTHKGHGTGAALRGRSLPQTDTKDTGQELPGQCSCALLCSGKEPGKILRSKSQAQLIGNPSKSGDIQANFPYEHQL